MSYEILRSSNGSNYVPISNVPARSRSFIDTRVSGLGTTYWYEVSARSPEGSSTTGAVSATTPLTCLSGGPVAPGGEAGNATQKAHCYGEDGDPAGGDAGVYLRELT
jgi:hypothetical protein